MQLQVQLVPRGGGLTETHRKAQPPHKVSTPFHCFHQMILPSLFTSRDPLILPEKCQITSSQPLLVLDWWKHPLFLDFTMQVQLVKNTHKTWKMAEPIAGFWASTSPLGELVEHAPNVLNKWLSQVFLYSYWFGMYWWSHSLLCFLFVTDHCYLAQLIK